jgi:hypothetical protein
VAAEGWFEKTYKRPFVTATDLEDYFTWNYHTFALLGYNWWVPRTVDGNRAHLFPIAGPHWNGYEWVGDWTGVCRTRISDGWPQHTQDLIAPYSPILSDDCISANITTNLSTIIGAHAVNKFVKSVNRTFADGRVETVPHFQIQWQHFGNEYAFY